MATEIQLYSTINEFSAADFIRQLNEAEGDDVVLRIASNGGNPEYMFGMVAKWQEYEGKKTVKVDGKAFSAAAFFLAYADEVQSLEVSEYLIHRAAYPNWFESEPEFFTEEIKNNLERNNKHLRTALEARIDVKKFEELKDVKMKDIFSMDSRLDVFLSAKEAKQIGLIDKINKITPTKRAELDNRIAAMAAKYEPQAETPKPKENLNPKNTKMKSLQELKENHPAIYAEAIEAGKKVGMEAERERVGAWLTYGDVDFEAVKKGVEEGKELGAKMMAELSRKAFSAENIAKIEDESANPESTATTAAPAPEKTKEEEAKAAFEASLDKQLGISKN